MKVIGLAGLWTCCLLGFANPTFAEKDICAAAVHALRANAVFGPAATCASSKPAFCETLSGLSNDRYEELVALFDKAPDSREARGMSEALAACGLDYAGLQYRQCQVAFRHEEIDFVLRHCPNEAWSLARAQCERNLDTISPRYYELCRRFGRPIVAAPGQ